MRLAAFHVFDLVTGQSASCNFSFISFHGLFQRLRLKCVSIVFVTQVVHAVPPTPVVSVGIPFDVHIIAHVSFSTHVNKLCFVCNLGVLVLPGSGASVKRNLHTGL